MMQTRALLNALFLSVLVVAAGCTTTDVDEALPAAAVDEAPVQELQNVMVAPEPVALEPGESPMEAAGRAYDEGRFEESLVLCVDLTRAAPDTPGLAALRDKVLRAIVDKRVDQSQRDVKRSADQMAVETREKGHVPDTYGMRVKVVGVEGSHRTTPGAMDQMLSTPVTIHLKEVDLSTFIDAVSRDQNINIIADKGVGVGKKVDMEMDNVPLKAVLDYLSRNMGVTFYVGENVIWVTAAGGKGSAPMETRIYRLRRGMQFHGADWSLDLKKPMPVSELTEQATQLSTKMSSLETVVTRFVPKAEGSDLFVDQNAHVLIARNTKENLSLIEEIIDSLDIVPPQVLIEARFVETTVSDLRELGLEWELETPLIAGDTQVEAGELVKFNPYTSDGVGTFPLGPQGDFGLLRDGNPDTSDQGMNLTYHGILTEPMFKAVLHALEITGKGQTLSVPRVTTVNNNPAKLRNGQDLRYFDQFHAQAFSLVDANNQKYSVTVLIPQGKPMIEELGITLIAVPSVGSDMRTVSLLLMPTISELEGWSYYQDTGGTNSALTADIRQVVAKLPIFARREIQTKVIVETGETVVLGGLIDTVKQNTVHAIPLLSQLPFIGALFRRHDVTEQRRNLLVFVTATVVSERGETLVPY